MMYILIIMQIRYVNSRAQENTEEKIRTEPTPEELEKEGV